MTQLDDSPITTNSKQRAALNTFCRKTGYSTRDILSLNYDTGIFLTRNGGQYKLKGEKITHMAGPAKNASGRL